MTQMKHNEEQINYFGCARGSVTNKRLLEAIWDKKDNFKSFFDFNERGLKMWNQKYIKAVWRPFLKVSLVIECEVSKDAESKMLKGCSII